MESDEQYKSYWIKRFRNDPYLRDDWRFWAWYLEHNGPFFEDLRPVLVKALRGKKLKALRGKKALRGEKRLPYRTKSVLTYLDRAEIALFVR
jgi:hypothetical protein